MAQRSSHTTIQYHGTCDQCCPGGAPCTCTNRPHVYHICSNPTCYCHTNKRYAEERRNEQSRIEQIEVSRHGAP